jgi:hypothetical protein
MICRNISKSIDTMGIKNNRKRRNNFKEKTSINFLRLNIGQILKLVHKKVLQRPRPVTSASIGGLYNGL